MGRRQYRHIQVDLGHPLARMNKSYRKRSNSVVLTEHRIVLYDAIGPGPHPCHWCGRLVDWTFDKAPQGDTLCVDHVNDDYLDNRVANLVPSCGPCNSHRLRRIQPSELFITNPNGTRSRAVERVCAVCDRTFLAKVALVKRGEGSTCSRSCAAVLRNTGSTKKKKPRIERTCQWCNVVFYVLPSQTTGHHGRYCSRKCRAHGSHMNR